MLRSFLTWFSVLLTTVLLAACCGSTACDCDDTFADAVGLRFNPDSVSGRGFSSNLVDTLYLVRNPLDTAQRPRADTVVLARPRRVALTQPVIINNATPFAQAGNRKLDQYSYQLYLAPSRTATPTFTYKIDRIDLRTDYDARGCCTCFLNTNKLVFTNGNLTPFNQTDPTGQNQLLPIEISRP